MHTCHLMIGQNAWNIITAWIFSMELCRKQFGTQHTCGNKWNRNLIQEELEVGWFLWEGIPKGSLSRHQARSDDRLESKLVTLNRWYLGNASSEDVYEMKHFKLHWHQRIANVILNVWFQIHLDISSISSEMSARWISQNLVERWSALVEVRAWCCEATSHNLYQCWSIILTPYLWVSTRKT